MKKNLLLTGGAGFIGSNFVKKIAAETNIAQKYNFIILDALTYAGHYATIQPEIEKNEHIVFHQIDIRNANQVEELFEHYRFDGVLHFAAESHVDNSIENPNIFFETNAIGTLNLLRASLKLYRESSDFRFLQVSTDEVYGSLGDGDPAFTEEHPLQPNSPYSSSKASADLLVRSFFHTYQLPVIITRCSNNYGPYQFPEKLIPVMISKALQSQPLPVYGKGENIRDWIFVDDHNRGVWLAFEQGRLGEVYNLGGGAERRNLDLVKTLLKILNKSEDLIEFVTDRPGHDYRYAINYSKAQSELAWAPECAFEEGLKLTVDWYCSNSSWLSSVSGKAFDTMA